MENTPNNWTKKTPNTINKYHSGISVMDVWRNQESGSILVHYMTRTTVKRNHYVELYQDPKTVESRFRKIKDLVTSEDVETNLSVIGESHATDVAKVSTKRRAREEAHRYMKNSPDGTKEPEHQFGRRRDYSPARDIRNHGDRI